MMHFPAICLVPGYLAEELLHTEGFDEVEYVDITVNLGSPLIASGRVDMRVEAEMLREIPCGQWREYDPEDALRFYALRMHDVGFIKSAPQQIVAQSADWRFLNELKRELKA
jgi:hypothetical protein